MIYPFNIRSKLFTVPLILGSLVASFYLLSIILTFLGNFSFIFGTIITAWIISVILGPLVNYMKKQGIAPIVAIIFSFIFFFIVLIVVCILIFPPLYNELNVVATKLAAINVNHEIHVILADLNLKQVNVATPVISNLNQFVSFLLNNTLTLLSNVFGLLFGLVLSFFFAFYFLSEGAQWKEYLTKILPPNVKPDFLVVTDSISEGIQGFLKGQTIVALIIAVCTMIIMRILGLNLIIVAGLYVFICMYFPMIGPIIGPIVPLLIALTTNLTVFIILLIAIVILMQIVINFIQPKIFSKSLGLHPVLVVLSVLIGAQLFGFAGAILALPAASIIQSLLIHYYKVK
jgi:predicted PurR-regulated permease PerM